jgi:hypothetical protein
MAVDAVANFSLPRLATGFPPAGVASTDMEWVGSETERSLTDGHHSTEEQEAGEARLREAAVAEQEASSESEESGVDDDGGSESEKDGENIGTKKRKCTRRLPPEPNKDPAVLKAKWCTFRELAVSDVLTHLDRGNGRLPNHHRQAL